MRAFVFQGNRIVVHSFWVPLLSNKWTFLNLKVKLQLLTLINIFGIFTGFFVFWYSLIRNVTPG
jgi:hypothetical protein